MAVASTVLALISVASSARADRVHLVGGTMIEGKATRQGDKVIVELSGGRIAIEAGEVVRIERSESDIERFEARYARLDEPDIAARIALADFCRDRGLRAREERLLREVIARAPDHAQARARLGFVREGGTWLSREQQLAREGLIEHEGRVVTREQQLELERLQARAARAAHARDKARLELEAKRAELEAQREDARERELQEAEREAQQPAVIGSNATFVGGAVYPYPYADRYGRPLSDRRDRRRHDGPLTRPHRTRSPEQPSCGAPPCPEQRPRYKRMIPGVRDPSEYF